MSIFRIGLLAVLLLALAEGANAADLVASSPTNGAATVELSASFNLRFSEALDPKTLGKIELRVAEGRDKPLRVRRSTDLTNASITIVPVEFLEPDVEYAIASRPGLKSRSGDSVTPFSITFRTTKAGLAGGPESLFTAETFDITRSMTTVLFGPDRRLYAASAFGELCCWDVDDEGRPCNRRTLFRDKTTSRQFIDLEWDPSATADNLRLWVSYAERLVPKSDPRHFFTGQIAQLTIRGDEVVDETILIRGLPHGREKQGGFDTLPHQPNGLCFRDGKLYQSVGSTSSSGGPSNWGIVEQPYSGCLLEIDYTKIDEPVDLIDGQPHRRVRRFASGIRNAVEVIAHSCGRLYTAVNINDRGGPADGVPDDPDLPGDQNKLIRQTTPDHESLYILERGRHYGFPNPSIGNYVLAGGNPTAGKDPFEISDYPVGTQPEPGFAPELMFPIWKWGGTSPNGMIEYLPQSDHPLKHAILCCFYSANDIAWMPLGPDGLPKAVHKLRSPYGKLAFAGPLDITQDPVTGSLYVADFGKQSRFGSDGSMVWLKLPYR